jgi:hypothetical protein
VKEREKDRDRKGAIEKDSDRERGKIERGKGAIGKDRERKKGRKIEREEKEQFRKTVRKKGR